VILGNLPQVPQGSRAVPRGITQGTIVGVQDREWVSCVLTRRRGGSWAYQNPRRVGERPGNIIDASVLTYPFSGVPQVYHSLPIDHTNVRGVAKRRVHVIRRGRYGTGTYKERGPGWRSDPGGGLRRDFGEPPAGAAMRPATIGVNRGPTGSEGWDVGCICTNMMPGERMGVPEPAWEDGIGVRGCPALRGTRGRSGRSTFLLLGARGGR